MMMVMMILEDRKNNYIITEIITKRPIYYYISIKLFSND